MIEESKFQTGSLRNAVYNQLINYCPKEQTYINDLDAENAIIYGIEWFRLKDNKIYNAIICISPISNAELNIFIIENSKIIKIDLETIANISFNNNTFQNFDYYSNFLNSNYICQILNDRKSYDFCFKNKSSLLLFVKGMLIISQNFSEKHNSHINISVDKFNDNFNNELEDDELKYFAAHLGINYNVLKSQIDINKDNTVSIAELKTYLKKRLSGQQFKPIFDKYATLENNLKERFMGPIDLQRFFLEVQKEEISYLESCQIIIEFNSLEDHEKKRKVIQNFEEILVKNKTINVQEIESILGVQNSQTNQTIKASDQLRLYLSLYEFNMMLHSLLLSVYDRKILNKELDLDRPITDYFIKSSHNTYLTDHQLKGESSTKMYSTSLLYNFRLVELDCYNGEEDNIIITHGFTLVTDLDLEDILHELKETAFINSDLPIILSIENHLDEKHQIIMVNKLKEILVDIYIFPYDIKPKYVPTLREMRKKFLIKCGGKKLWENDYIPRKPYNINVNNLNHNLYLYLRQYPYQLNQANPLNQIHKTYEEKKIIFLNKRKFTKSLNKKHTNIDNTSKLMASTRSKIDRSQTVVYETSKALENARGLLGVKFNKDKIKSNYYKPWEMITLKCSKALKFSEDFIEKRNMINLSQQCLIKVYPEKFDSSNYNMIKCLSCGFQACALNIQATDDDFILYDKIFFKQNQGFGYVLKPEKFFSKDFNNFYDKPLYIFHMEIISLINCSKLIENAKLKVDEDGELSIKIYSIGIKEDEKNPELNCKLSNGTMFPNFVGNFPTINYNVYDYELSAIMIKIKYKDKMVGRSCIPYYFMKKGFRRIPIYNNQCFNEEDVYMVGFFSMQKI